MNLRYLSDNGLIEVTKKLVSKEREILAEILHYLREIERRRLFSSLGFRSLFDYCVKQLGYSEAQTYRRITAMKLIKELPEVEEKIASGSLNLSHLGLAQSLFKKENLSKNIKMEVLEKLENTPARKAQKIVLSLSSQPQSFIPDKARQVTSELTELRFTVTEELKEKIEQVRGIYAHAHPHMTMAELMNKLCDLAIGASTLKKRCVKKDKCESCGSTYALQIDHIIPRAKGGSDDPKNLRTLCRNCNQRAAIKEFGLHKMDEYIN